MLDDPPSPAIGVNRLLILLAVLLASAVVILIVVAANVGIAGAVIAQGQVSVESGVKKVQHPTGGVVSSLLVHDGSRVKAGDLLLTLDSTSSSANASIVGDIVDRLGARQARLEAERDSLDRISSDSSPAESSPAARMSEDRLFRLHRSAQNGAKSQLNQRIVQLREQIRGYQELSEAKRTQIRLIDQELVGVRQLYAQDLVPLPRLNALERDAAQLKGDVAQLSASMAEVRGKINETSLQMLQVDQNARADAGNQLGDVQGRLDEARGKSVTAQQELRRVSIIAPQDGVVDRMMIHTVGGVISAGESILQIVPVRDSLRVEAKVRPSDISKVHVGQAVFLRFTSFDQRVTPEVRGTVSHTSAQAETDERSPTSYYIVYVSLIPAEVAKAQLSLVPGMPVEVFIQTNRLSLLSFITKPLADQLRRAFREG